MNLPSSAFDSGGQFAWDSTSLKLATECPRKYYLKMIAKVEPRGTSPHLLFGGLFAKALEDFYKEISIGTEREVAIRKIVHWLLVQTWDANGQFQLDFGHNKKSRDSLLRTFIWYMEEFAESHYETVILANGKPAVELSFKLELRDGILYCGHIDRLAIADGRKFVTDNKTTGSALNNYFFSNFDLDIQMSGYTWAGRVMYDSPIAGVMIDGAEIGVNYTRFLRGFTYRTTAQLEEFLEETGAKISEMRARFVSFLSIGERAFPRNLTACGNYGGCAYKDICSSLPRLRPNIVAGNYTVKETSWNPLEIR